MHRMIRLQSDPKAPNFSAAASVPANQEREWGDWFPNASGLGGVGRRVLTPDTSYDYSTVSLRRLTRLNNDGLTFSVLPRLQVLYPL